ncbi:hypothetical protein I317_05669 [Kwoniella heveanensis CBS 569]|uniref:Uncharacterized protein n=1 Tax=Kwoniella heveanensis BCC8398 TaxID=1296120 RepID=A0A1B9GI37_9TREE|nr:hypothetical protein I316_07713 [Kwoniella heveanensis BCC8398]OCF40499.1 hypothetical protein I317_05669 [Kwoniella heveanensis CBS 569]
MSEHRQPVTDPSERSSQSTIRQINESEQPGGSHLRPGSPRAPSIESYRTAGEASTLVGEEEEEEEEEEVLGSAPQTETERASFRRRLRRFLRGRSERSTPTESRSQDPPVPTTATSRERASQSGTEDEPRIPIARTQEELEDEMGDLVFDAAMIAMHHVERRPIRTFAEAYVLRPTLHGVEWGDIFNRYYGVISSRRGHGSSATPNESEQETAGAGSSNRQQRP